MIMLVRLHLRIHGYRLRSAVYPHKPPVYWIDGPDGHLTDDMGLDQVRANAVRWVHEHREIRRRMCQAAEK